MGGYTPQVSLSCYVVETLLSLLAICLYSSLALAAATGDPQVGRKLFVTHCYSCHGVSGRGDGPAASRLQPKPRNLTDDAFMSRKTDQDIYNVISGGSTAMHRFSGMPDWKSIFYPERIWDLVAYVRALHRPRQQQEHPLIQLGKSDAGKRVYADYCAICHGQEGKGDGPLVTMFGPKPFAFTDTAAMAAKTDMDLYSAIFDGGEAVGKSTYMPAWGGLLNEAEIADVIAYLRTLPR